MIATCPTKINIRPHLHNVKPSTDGAKRMQRAARASMPAITSGTKSACVQKPKHAETGSKRKSFHLKVGENSIAVTQEWWNHKYINLLTALLPKSKKCDDDVELLAQWKHNGYSKNGGVFTCLCTTEIEEQISIINPLTGYEEIIGNVCKDRFDNDGMRKDFLDSRYYRRHGFERFKCKKCGKHMKHSTRSYRCGACNKERKARDREKMKMFDNFRFPRGKHKNKTIYSIPLSYLKWAHENWDDSINKAVLRKFIILCEKAV